MARFDIDIDAGGNKLRNLAQGILADDATTLAQVKALIQGTMKGGYNATTNVPALHGPGMVTIEANDKYNVQVGGSFYTTTLAPGDVLMALVNNPTTEAEWMIVEMNIVDSDDVTEGSTNLYMTPAEKADLHTHLNKAQLDLITNAGSGSIITNAERLQLHDKNKDTILDEGGANEVSAATILTHINDSTIHRVIDDAVASLTTLYSGTKIESLITSAISANSKTYVFETTAVANASLTAGTLRLGDGVIILNRAAPGAMPEFRIVRDAGDGSWANAKYHWVIYYSHMEAGKNQNDSPTLNNSFVNGTPQRLKTRTGGVGVLFALNWSGAVNAGVHELTNLDPRPSSISGDIDSRYRFAGNVSFSCNNSSSDFQFPVWQKIGAAADQYEVGGPIHHGNTDIVTVPFERVISSRTNRKHGIGVRRLNGGANLTVHTAFYSIVKYSDRKYI
jgi:hypothetical protein